MSPENSQNIAMSAMPFNERRLFPDSASASLYCEVIMETKVCYRCKQEKPLSEFSKRRSSKDGAVGECKTCDSDRCRNYYKKNKEKVLKQKSDYYKKNRERVLEQRYAYVRKDPVRAKAHMLFKTAVKRGKIIRPDVCSLCKKPCKPDGHHHNGYSEEHMYDVIWLCSMCHKREHMRLKEMLNG